MPQTNKQKQSSFPLKYNKIIICSNTPCCKKGRLMKKTGVTSFYHNQYCIIKAVLQVEALQGTKNALF